MSGLDLIEQFSRISNYLLASRYASLSNVLGCIRIQYTGKRLRADGL